jgi:hypothetical protein
MESLLFQEAIPMRPLVALLFCLVPATTFAAPIQLSLSGTVISKDSLLSVVDVGDPFSATITYDLPTGATSATVTGFMYYKNRTWSFRDVGVGMSNGLPLGSAGEIFTEWNGLGLVDTTFNPPREFAPGRVSITMSPTTFWARVGFHHSLVGNTSFFATGAVTSTGIVTPVPEPTTLGLLATGLAIGVARRLRKSRAGH